MTKSLYYFRSSRREEALINAECEMRNVELKIKWRLLTSAATLKLFSEHSTPFQSPPLSLEPILLHFSLREFSDPADPYTDK